MIFLNHLKNQTHDKKRTIARNIAIGFGVVLLLVWVVVNIGFSRKVINYPDFKTPFSILTSGIDGVIDSVSTGISNIKK